MTSEILYAVTLGFAGYLLYVFSGFVRSLAFLLIWSFRSAKNELRTAFRMRCSIGDLL